MPQLKQWESTPWDVAVRWLAQRSRYFHSLDSDAEATPIIKYENELRYYLTATKRDSLTRSTKAAAELLEFESQGMTAKLYQKLKSKFPNLSILKHLHVSQLSADADGKSEIERLKQHVNAIDQRSRKKKSPREIIQSATQ